MFGDLLRGSRVLRLMGVLKRGLQTVAVIRHSERPSFDNLPYHEWDDAGLTDKGTKEAVRFGRSIAQTQNPKCLQISWWGLKRCALTAEAISEGARDEGCPVLGPYPIAFKSPIARREEYDKALHSGQWDQFISDWLRDESPQVAMVPARQYAKEIYRALLAAELCSPGKITIVVTHDLHILPLARLFFPSSSRWIDYLDGMVLKVEDKIVSIGFDGATKYIKRDRLFSK